MDFKKVPDKEVRRLLRRLRTPKSLEDVTLARAIRDKTGHGRTADAVLQFLEATFAQYGPEGSFLFSLIRRADIVGTEPHAAIAGALHLSTRQYYRYRSRAVHLIVRALNELFSERDDADPLEALATAVESADPIAALAIRNLSAAECPDAERDRLQARSTTVLEVAGDHAKAAGIAATLRECLRFRNHERRADILFELAYRDFVSARYRSSSSLMGEALREMNATAGSIRANDVLASICELEMALRFDEDGEIADNLRATLKLAQQRADAFVLEACSLRLGEASLTRGCIAEASRVASAVALGARNNAVLAGEAAVLANRLALLTDDDLPYPCGEEEPASHDGAMLAATCARRLARIGRHGEAARLGERILRYARERGHVAPLVWSLVTLGETKAAWIHAVASGDRVLLADAFEASQEKRIATDAALGDPIFAAALNRGLLAQQRSPFKDAVAAGMTYAAAALHVAVTGEVRPTTAARVSSALREERIAATTFRRFQKSAITFISSALGAVEAAPARDSNLERRSARLHDFHDAVASYLRVSDDCGAMDRKRAG